MFQSLRTNELFDDYVVFDIETSGLNPHKDKIIEMEERTDDQMVAKLQKYIQMFYQKQVEKEDNTEKNKEE